MVSTHDDHGAPPRHPSDYVNTQKLKMPNGVSPTTDESDVRPPPLPPKQWPPPKQWRRATNSDLFRPVQDEPVGEAQDEALGSGEQDDGSGEDLIDLDGAPVDQEPGDVAAELGAGGDQGKKSQNSTILPPSPFDDTQTPEVSTTQTPEVIGSDWAPEVRGTVPRPPVPFDVFIEIRHAEGTGSTRYYWMESCSSQSMITRHLTRQDYFCLVGFFTYHFCFCVVEV